MSTNATVAAIQRNSSWNRQRRNRYNRNGWIIWKAFKNRHRTSMCKWKNLFVSHRNWNIYSILDSSFASIPSCTFLPFCHSNFYGASFSWCPPGRESIDFIEGTLACVRMHAYMWSWLVLFNFCIWYSYTVPVDMKCIPQGPVTRHAKDD
jgi:hypothetical protein